MPDEELDKIQAVQEAQYDYPYHYIPRVEHGTFSRTRYWSWGHHYLGGLEVVLDELDGLKFDSLLDVGCGDGRFLAEVAQRYPEANLVGIDHSVRSISLARGIHGVTTNTAPSVGTDYENAEPTECIKFIAGDLQDVELGQTFDVATAIEVFEHIPPEDLDDFVSAMAGAIEPGGHILATVPHANKPLQDKHYQHFSGKELRSILEPYFEELTIVPFDRHSYLLSGLSLLLGGKGNHIVITNRTLNRWFYRLYKRRYRYAPNEASCRRIAITGVKR